MLKEGDLFPNLVGIEIAGVVADFNYDEFRRQSALFYLPGNLFSHIALVKFLAEKVEGDSKLKMAPLLHFLKIGNHLVSHVQVQQVKDPGPVQSRD